METNEEKAKKYQGIKRKLTLFHLFFTPALLFVLILSGLTFGMRQNAIAVLGVNDWGVVAVYFILFTLYFLIFDLPVAYFTEFVLEHRFGLSNQSARQWMVEFVKKITLSFVFSLVLLEIFYWIVREYPATWWLWAWAAYAFVSYVMGKLFPVFIVPLFYKYGKLEDKVLEEKVLKLAGRFGMPVQNVYSINLSKTTKKANAAFMGMGKTKRIVLSDTLINHFTHEEIETVLAHELGHFKSRDVWRLFGFGLMTSLAAFIIGFWGVSKLSVAMRLNSAADVAGLPLLFLIFFGVNLILTPASNAYSRRRERAADLFALRACGNKDVFISCMQKLGSQNLADPVPPVWYEWFFYDHPAIHRRVEMARKTLDDRPQSADHRPKTTD